MENRKIRVAITHGDTNGIGYELIFKTFAETGLTDLCTPIIYGSPKVAAYHHNAFNLPCNFATITHASDAGEGRLNMLTAVENDVKVDLGQSTPEAAHAAMTALDRAILDYRDDLFDVLVTLPMNLSDIQSEGMRFKSQGNYIEKCIGEGHKALEMLVDGAMRVASVTGHLPIKDVPSALTKETLIERATVLSSTLRRDFHIDTPRIAVLALNPDTGNGGQAGLEEQEIIAPAIAELAENDIYAFGPFASETFFDGDAYTHFDGILSMYNDQGTTPIKAFCYEGCTHVTAGLSLVHTAPAIGVSYEQVGKGHANENLLRQAIYLAIDIYRHRENYDAPLAHPLKKLYREKRDDSEKVRFAVSRSKGEKAADKA